MRYVTGRGGRVPRTNSCAASSAWREAYEIPPTTREVSVMHSEKRRGLVPCFIRINTGDVPDIFPA
jgi:hypothetical protein